MKTLFIFLISFLMFSNTRDIYIFCNASGSALKNKQIAELNKDEKGLRERNITVHIIQTTEGNKEARKWNVNLSAPFTFLLVGKDGGEKLRSSDIVSNEKLFSIIDAMPMRKQEMKKGN